MGINVNAAIENGCYGKYVYNEKNKTWDFNPYGKAIFIEAIEENIENSDVSIVLSFNYLGNDKYFRVPRKALYDKNSFEAIADKGADITAKNYDLIVNTLRLQEENFEIDNNAVDYVYRNLGWIKLPVEDDDGNVEHQLCFRSYKLLGPVDGYYIGNLSVEPRGKYSEWKNMVEEQVIGNTLLEICLLAGLSAVVVSLIATERQLENPIYHLHTGSGLGKTSALYLATSVGCKPHESTVVAYDSYGIPVEKSSLFKSWGSTATALTARCADINSYPIAFNELGKFRGKNVSDVIYNLSEGSDKDRARTNATVYNLAPYHTTFLSCGEISLLEQVEEKVGGHEIRVMEIKEPLTKSAEQADEIKRVSMNHCGWAVPKLAQYILDNGGIDTVLDLYDKVVDNLKHTFPDTFQKERFIEKFPATILVTAILAKKALGIKFSMAAIRKYFYSYELENGNERNVTSTCYDILISEFRTNISKFFDSSKTYTPNEVWGKVDYPKKPLPNNKILAEEYTVYPQITITLLKKHGYKNVSGCFKELKKLDGVLYYEAGKNYRERKINPNGAKEKAYVFRVITDAPPSPPKPYYQSTLLSKRTGTVICQDLEFSEIDEADLPF